jgi:DNA-3-methyladenine glycosylase II
MLRYRVKPFRPYSLERTLERLARFEERVDCYEGGSYRRLLYVGNRPLLLEVGQEGPPARATLKVTLRGENARTKEARAVASRVLDRVLGAGVDIRPFRRRFASDVLLGPLLRRHAGLRIAGRLSAWETLLQIVLSQQINLALAHGILAELAEVYGRRAVFDRRRYYTFPSPRALAMAKLRELRRLRLSRAKAETLKRLASAFESGELSDATLEALSDEEAIDCLTSYKGVGRWTAEFTLLRGLGRVDVFPASDLGVVKYLAQGLLGRDGKAREDEMRAFAEGWRPYRGLALIYAYAELASRTGKGE